MLYNYAALAFFVVFGLSIPASYLLASRLLRRQEPRNAVKNAPFESGEDSIGTERNIQSEYLPYFVLFLPFEIVIAILFLWSYGSRSIPSGASAAVVALALIASVFSLLGYRLASERHG